MIPCPGAILEWSYFSRQDSIQLQSQGKKTVYAWAMGSAFLDFHWFQLHNSFLTCIFLSVPEPQAPRTTLQCGSVPCWLLVCVKWDTLETLPMSITVPCLTPTLSQSPEGTVWAPCSEVSHLACVSWLPQPSSISSPLLIMSSVFFIAKGSLPFSIVGSYLLYPFIIPS